MHFKQVRVQNFRNFRDCTVPFGPSTVIVGENKVGKSNLMYAIRLVLDPRLPDSERQLKIEDFCDSISRPLDPDTVIQIDVDITGFDNDTRALAVLAEHLVDIAPAIARISYVFRPRGDLDGLPTKDSDYEFLLFGQGDPDRPVRASLRHFISVLVLPALRDAESDLANWRNSPLAPLLKTATSKIDLEALRNAAGAVYNATEVIAQLEPLSDLGGAIEGEVSAMVGPVHGSTTKLGFLPTAPDKILKSMRLLIDDGKRSLGDASLGTANLIYLALLTLELKRQVTDDDHCHTFLAIEEPEAHLHPHLQRLAFRRFLRDRSGFGGTASGDAQTSVVVTTHSPYIVSVSPLESLVLLKDLGGIQGTIATATRSIALSDPERTDLERYLDVTRGEMLFAKAVLLVEGIAEVYTVPALAKSAGIDLDAEGITVCSVEGVNFVPYVQLLSSLRIPFAVITDLDPQLGKDALAVARVSSIAVALAVDVPKTRDPFVTGELHGIFVNQSTLEIELVTSGNANAVAETLESLTGSGIAKMRAKALATSGKIDDQLRFIKDIEEIGKGRFAQRLSSRLSSNATMPSYIQKAIDYVRHTA